MSWSDSKLSDARSPSSDDSEACRLESLVTRHYGFVWRSLRSFGLSRTDAEDAAQQVFMIAARKLDQISPERASSFLYGTARRVANNARRGLRRRRESPEADPGVSEPGADDPERETEAGRARALLAELLAELPDPLRRVLALAEIEQLEVQEIARLESIPVGTAASRLRRARERFRVLLEAAQTRNPYAKAR